MAIIKMEGLNKRFTEVVAQYMAQGLTLNANAMSGSQGEMGKVALANDKHVYMIYLHEEDIGKWTDMHEVVKLTVELFVRDKSDLVSNFHTYWLRKGETVYEEIFHQIAENRSAGKVYVTTEEEWKQSRDKQMERLENKDSHFGSMKEVPYDVETIISVIKSHTGRKRVLEENILKVTRHTKSNCWHIDYMFSGHSNGFGVSYSA